LKFSSRHYSDNEYIEIQVAVVSDYCEPLLEQLMDINESPVYVLLNPSINHSQKDLPVSIYESGT